MFFEAEIIMKKYPPEFRQQIKLFLLLVICLSSTAVYAQGGDRAGATPLQPVITSQYLPPEEVMTAPPVSIPFSIPSSPIPDEEINCRQSFPCWETDSEESSFHLFRSGSRLRFNGWVESGLYTNAHGATAKYGPHGGGLQENSGNGPIFGPGLRTTNFNMNQLWGRFAREMDCASSLDWGFQADLLYGMSAYDVQSSESFDNGWGKGDYGLGFHQLYGEVGYKRLSALYGKFGTPIGWEETASWENFFYSHSYCFNIEPLTHTGALARFQLTDDLKLIGGWSAGMESGFANRYGDQSLIGGMEAALSKRSTLYYYMTQGRMKNGLDKDGFARFDGGLDVDYFIQSLCFEWRPAGKWTLMCQYNLNRMHEIGGDRVSAYGINNHLIYAIDEKWGIGFRAEWLRDNGVLAYEDALGNSNHSDYVQLTLGLNYRPTENLRIRPEIRYDHAFKTPIFAYGTKHEQLSGGFAVLYGF